MLTQQTSNSNNFQWTPFQIKKLLNGIDFEKCAVLFHKHKT
jgi:hypothetical protein